MSKYIVIDPIYGCPHCNLISRDESEVDSCAKKHEMEMEEFLKISNFLTFLKSKTTDVFHNTLSSDPMLPFPGISKLIKLEEALINLAKTVGFQLIFSNFKYRSIDFEKKSIKFDADGRLIRMANFSADSFFINSEYSPSDLDVKYKNLDRKNVELIRFIKDTLFKNKLYFKELLFLSGIESLTNYTDYGFSSLLYYNYSNDNLIISEVEEYNSLLKSKERKNLKSLELYSKYMKDRFPFILISDVVYSVKSSMLKDLEIEQNILSSKMDNLRSDLQLRNSQLLAEDSKNIPIPDSSYEYNEKKLNIFTDIFSNKLK